jgi:DNA-binding CsgD family transcriptional regulator
MLLEPSASVPWAARPAPPPLPAPSLRSFPGGAQRLRATTLSPREHEILRHLVDGLPNKAIARALDITEATVKVHIKGLLRKMNMTNRTQAAVWALSHRLHDDAAGAAEAAVDRIAAAPRHGFPVPADDPVVATGPAAAPARAAAPAMNGAVDG